MKPEELKVGMKVKWKGKLYKIISLQNGIKLEDYQRHSGSSTERWESKRKTWRKSNDSIHSRSDCRSLVNVHGIGDSKCRERKTRRERNRRLQEKTLILGYNFTLF